MKKTITIEEAVSFLNRCASVDPRNTTELLNNVKIACAVKLLFSEDSDKLDSIQINRNKTGAVIGFAQTEKPGKKEMPPPKPKPSPVRFIKEDDETGGRGKKKGK